MDKATYYFSKEDWEKQRHRLERQIANEILEQYAADCIQDPDLRDLCHQLADVNKKLAIAYSLGPKIDGY